MSHVNQLFVSDLLNFGNDFVTVLDVGAGTAQIPIELCRRHAAVRVVAIDMAQHMIDLGRATSSRPALTDRIELRLIDAKKMPFADRQL